MNYDYALLINLDAVPYDGELYAEEYTFGKVSYQIEIYEEGVAVHKFTKSKSATWTFEDIGRDLHDALRKAHLLYALCVGKGLKVEKYKVFLNGKLCSEITDDNSGQFPYVYSVLAGADLINESAGHRFNGVFGNEKIMDYFAHATRTDSRLDKKAVAVYAFLQGRSREFEVDRFINYWTSINAIYGLLNEEHKKIIEERVAELPEEYLVDKPVIKEDLVHLFSPYGEESDDGNKINMFVSVIEGKRKFKKKSAGISQAERSAAWKKINEQYTDPYKIFADEYRDEKGRIRFSFGRLYDIAASNVPVEKLEFGDEKEKESYNKLVEWATELKCPVYTFLSINKPYALRNHFVHGSEVSVLISDAYHLHMLSCLNYFMDQLLGEFIPYLFDDEEFYGLLSEVHHVMYGKQHGRKKDMSYKDKNGNKRVIKLKDIATTAKEIARESEEYKWMEGKEL